MLEPETGEWSNAHVSNLSFQSMIGLRYQEKLNKQGLEEKDLIDQPN